MLSLGRANAKGMTQDHNIDELQAARKVLTAKIVEAEAAEQRHDSEERKHRALKEAQRMRKEQLRAVLDELGTTDDDYDASSVVHPAEAKTTDDDLKEVRPEVSPHKANYRKWVDVCKQALRLAGGSGTFSRLAQVAREHRLVDPNRTDRELEGMRGALHGLAKRTRNKTVEYVPSTDGSGGLFRTIHTKQPL